MAAAAIPRNRVCRRCGSDLWLQNGPPTSTGYQPWACSPCKVANALAWQKRNPELRREYVSRGCRKFNLAKYGLTVDEYDRLFRAQNGLCAICQEPELNRRLAVDHAHGSRLVRGLLCGSCNRAIGLMGESPKRLRAAARYLGRP